VRGAYFFENYFIFYKIYTFFNFLKDIESTNDSSVLSHKTTSCNSSINTIDEITKSFENAINVGEKYLSKLKNFLARFFIFILQNF
jgi:hypothetical protein